MLRRVVACILLVAPVHGQHATVPFVGCPADGQLGPQAPPRRTSKTVHFAPDLALKLAWYEGKYAQGVLAPRGWHCSVAYGSNGATTYVSPERLRRSALPFQAVQGVRGPAVKLSEMLGGTSGRWAVAGMISRVFPAYLDFATDVRREFPATDPFPSGPYAPDRLHYLNDHALEYLTPAGSNGLGTTSFLLPSDSPIQGVEMLTGADTDLISLATRLPPELGSLAPVIAQEVERANRSPPPKP